MSTAGFHNTGRKDATCSMIGFSPLELLLIIGLLAIVVGIPTIVVLISMSFFGGKKEDRERRD